MIGIKLTRRHFRGIILFVFLAETRAGILFLLCIGVLLRHAGFNLGRLLLAVGGAARRDASLHESAELVVRREGLEGVILVEIVDEFEEAIDAYSSPRHSNRVSTSGTHANSAPLSAF